MQCDGQKSWEFNWKSYKEGIFSTCHGKRVTTTANGGGSGKASEGLKIFSKQENVLQNSNLKIQTKLTDVRVDFANGEHAAARVGGGVRARVPGRHDDDHDDEEEGDRMKMLPWVPHVGVVSADAGAASAAGNHTWTCIWGWSAAPGQAKEDKGQREWKKRI